MAEYLLSGRTVVQWKMMVSLSKYNNWLIRIIFLAIAAVISVGVAIASAFSALLITTFFVDYKDDIASGPFGVFVVFVYFLFSLPVAFFFVWKFLKKIRG